MASGLQQLSQLMQLKSMQDASKAAAYRQQQDRKAAMRQDRSYDLELERFNLAKDKVQRAQSERQGRANLTALVAERYKGAITGQGFEEGPRPPDQPVDQPRLFRDIMASGEKGAMEFAKEYKSLAMPTTGASGVFGQQMRALGTDLGFYSHVYGGGEVPSDAEELESMTVAAAQDPDFNRKRQEWSGLRVANTMKNLGLSSVDPDKNIYEDRFGTQHLMDSKGDTIKQQLANPTTEETKALSEYGNTFSEIGKIRDSFNEDFVGLFQGNWQNLKSKFADTPSFQRFKTKSNQLRTIIYGLSGKQINETEQKWLDSILPKIYQPDENFLANMDEIEEWVKDRHQMLMIELRNSRKFTGATPLGTRLGREAAPTPVQYTAEQEDTAFAELGVDASDEDLDAWLLDKYGGK